MTNATHARFIGILLKSRVVRSTITAETLSLSEGCDVAFHMNKIVPELLIHDGKQLNIIAYTDNQSLKDAAHTLKQTLEKSLLDDISAIREMIERTEINITWIEKTKQVTSLQKLEHHPISH